MPPVEPIADETPWSDHVTDYDRSHFDVYLRLLDATAEGADEDEIIRVVLDIEKVQAWLAKGAQPTDRVLRFLDAAGLAKRAARNNPKKAEPGDKAKERAAAKAEEAAAPAAEEAAAE